MNNSILMQMKQVVWKFVLNEFFWFLKFKLKKMTTTCKQQKEIHQPWGRGHSSQIQHKSMSSQKF